MMTITMRVRMADAQREMQRMQAQVARLQASMVGAGGGARGFGRSMMAATKHMERFGKNMQWVGRQIEFNFTLPLAIAAGFATKWALENERAFTRLRKVYNESVNDAYTLNQELEYLGRGFRALSDIMGVHQDEVIAIGAQWAQAGATGVGLLRSTQSALELMILGEMEAVEATEALIAVQSQFGLTSKELRQEIAYLNAIENETATSMKGLIQALARGGGIAREAGVDIRTFAAMVASITPAAGTATQAGNGLRTMITRIMAPTNAAAEELESLGIAVNTTTWQSKNFIERVKEISSAMDGMATSARTNALTELGSRWQVNRLSVLLRDLGNAMDETTEAGSRFAKAMAATEDPLAAMKLYDRELAIFLASTPQAFSILTTQIRNLATEIIQPLLPVMIAFLAQVRDWIRAFTNLAPETQKNILMMLLFIAVLGPVIRYMGATILLASQLIAFFKGIGAVAGFVVSALGFIGKGFKSLFLLMLGEAPGRALGKLYRAFSTTFSAIGKLTMSFAKGMARIFTTMFGFLAKQVVAFATWMVPYVGAMWTGVLRVSGAAGRALLLVVSGALRGLLVLVTRFLTALVLRVLVPVAASILTALATPWVIAAAAIAILIAALVVLVWKFPEEVGKATKAVAGWVGQLPQVFVALGRALQRVFVAIIEMAITFFSYLNPFARHSPSLVDNVTRGVERISKEFAKLRNLRGHFQAATDALNNFKAATAAAARGFELEELAELREKVVSAAPNAGGAFDRLAAEVHRLKGALVLLNAEIQKQARVVNVWRDKLDEATKKVDDLRAGLDKLRAKASDLESQISAAQSVIDRLANTPIAGMRAYSDALFENEMAQKRVRLAILEMEKAQKEAGNSTDDLRGRLAALTGDIEMLRGKREDLRLAGAGSDVLGTFDQQIAAMEAERKAMMGAGGGATGPNAELEALRSQLEDLQREAEMTNLREALEFDPLRREIADLVNGLEELTFEQIISGIQEQQRVIERLTPRLDEVNEAIRVQEGLLRDAEEARDRINDRYEQEMETLDLLTTAYADLERQISEMEAAMRDFASAFEKASSRAAAAAKGVGDAMEAVGDFGIPGGTAGIGEEAGDLLAMVEDLEAKMQNAFGDFDLWGPFKQAWAKIKEGVGNWFSEFWEDVKGGWHGVKEITKGAFKLMWETITGKLGEWKDGIVNWFSTTKENIDRKLIEWRQSIRDKFTSMRDTINEKLTEARQRVRDRFYEISGNISDSVNEWLTKWRGRLGDMKAALDEKLIQWRDNMRTKLGEMKANMDTRLTEWRDKWRTRLGEMKTNLDEKLLAWKDSMRTKLTDMKSTLDEKLLAWKDSMRTKLTDMKANLDTRLIEWRDGVRTRMGEMAASIAENMGAMKSAWATGWSNFSSTVSDQWNTIKSTVRSGVNSIIGFLNRLITKWNGFELRIGGFSTPDWVPGIGGKSWDGATISTPNVPYIPQLATGAVIDRPTLALIGETQRARPEIVSPERLMRRIVREEIRGTGTRGGDSGRTNNFYGDLSFPNVKDGDDAEAFIRNLENLAGV